MSELNLQNNEANFDSRFNPSTTFKFTLEKNVSVNLNIYKILGETVKKLVNKEMNADYHQVEFNATKFASGVYLCRIIAGNFVETKKMILMK